MLVMIVICIVVRYCRAAKKRKLMVHTQRGPPVFKATGMSMKSTASDQWGAPPQVSVQLPLVPPLQPELPPSRDPPAPPSLNPPEAAPDPSQAPHSPSNSSTNDNNSFTSRSLVDEVSFHLKQMLSPASDEPTSSVLGQVVSGRV